MSCFSARLINKKSLKMEVAIFCKVIDNFGDAGFCLRLARGLSNKFDIVRIYCNDITLINKLFFSQKYDDYFMPKNLVMLSYNYELKHKEISSIGLILEVFQAEPPLDFLRKIDILGRAKRVIIDHLVTEKRMDSFQYKCAPDYKLLKFFKGSCWKNSPSANRVWIAPGFSAMSGGLISGGWKKLNSCERTEFRNCILNSNETKIKKNKASNLGLVFIICVFLYEIDDFFLQCSIPAGFDSLALWEPKEIVMNQVEFDCALQSCDFNFVRGEDSFVSAHNAAASEWKVPFVWQPYLEKKEGHIKKFENWKKIFPDNKFHSYWELATLIATRKNIDFADKWKRFISDWNLFRIDFHVVCLKITNQKSLEQTLLNYVEDNLP